MSPTRKRTKAGGGAGKNGKATQRNSAGEGQEEGDEEESLLDRPLWSHVSDRVTGLLRQGLGDRCVLARPLCGVAGEAGEDFQGERERRTRRRYGVFFIALSGALFYSSPAISLVGPQVWWAHMVNDQGTPTRLSIFASYFSCEVLLSFASSLYP